MNEKLISLKKLLKLKADLKKSGRKIVFTNGCFDIIHEGHIFLLKKAKSFGDILAVGLNSDISVRKIKGKNRPVNNQKSRLTVLSAIEYVDKIIIFNEETPYKLLKKLKPDVLVKGADYSLKDIIGQEFANSVKRMALKKGRSTTSIIRKIAALD